MKAIFPVDADSDERLDEVLGMYLTALDEGRAPEAARLLADYPELASALSKFFADAEHATRWTAPLRTIAEAARARQATSAAVGTCFGDYELLAEIGSGGMGVVYRARQRSLNRVVALKMIGGSQFSSTAQHERFRHEAETVARLDHPRIVPVYEVGEWNGERTGPPVPFFTMKLFEAGSLADCLDRFAAEPAAAAEIVVEIARAIHHAHQRGVLHRDLKPSNIVLDADRRPHVADFGLAKLAATAEGVREASLTSTGALVGTPGYMAPEQVLGLPLTTAADVYGLGAILYALLTGQPPFRTGSVLETLERVRDREPESPMALNPRVDRDLQAICLKCLAKRPEERYGSALALAEDLECWLSGKAIQARPVAMTARLWRWCRRNPLLAGLSATAAVAGLAALTALVVGLVLISREKNQKDRALTAESEQRQRAEAKERLARRAVDDYMRVTEELLASQPGMTQTARQSFERALAFYEDLVREQSADPQVRFRMAQAHHFVGRMRTQLGQPLEAEQAYRRQIELLNDLAAEFPNDPKYRFDLFHSYRALAIVLQTLGRETDHALQASVEFIQDLVRDHPEDPTYRDALAAAKIHLGCLVRGRGTPNEGERLVREALSTAEALDREYPDNQAPPHYGNNVGQSLLTLGDFFVADERSVEAKASFQRAASVWEKLAAKHSREPEEPAYRRSSVVSLLRLSDLYLNENRFTEAHACLERCLPGAERLAREFPNVLAYCTCAWQAQLQLAYCLLGLGRPQEAEAAFRHALMALEQVVRDFPSTPELKTTLAYWLCAFPNVRLRDPLRAVELAQATPAASRKPASLGPAYYRAGRWKESIRELEKTSDVLHHDTVGIWLFLTMAHWQNGDKEKARRLYDQTIAWMGKHRLISYSDRCLRTEAAELLKVNTK
jgi:serine/threonine-protein kinase